MDLSKLIPACIMLAFVAGICLTVSGLLSMPGTGAKWEYLAIVSVLTPLVLFGCSRWRHSPSIVAMAVGFAMCVLTGNLFPLLVVVGFVLAALLVGKAVTGALGAANPGFSTIFAFGSGVYATVIGILAHFPINYPGLYAAILIVPLLLGWRSIREWAVKYWQCQLSAADRTTAWDAGLEVMVISIGLILGFLAFLPEIGTDALAMHLFLPAQMAARHRWGFDAALYVWAVMPSNGDWIYTIGYLLGGESAARLMNVAFIISICALIRDLVLWAGGDRHSWRWAVGIFLSVPLTFTEGTSLFIESIWCCFLVAGILNVLKSCSTERANVPDLILGVILIGFALSSKSVTFAMLPALFLVFIARYKLLLQSQVIIRVPVCIFFFVLAGCVPYVTAWISTGNPVFPFFNGVFKSPLYPAANFEPPAAFDRGFHLDTFYAMTFQSQRFLESVPGVAGFQWLLLGIPAVVSLVLFRQRKALAILSVAAMFLVLVFRETAYLRYGFPFWIMGSAIIGIAMSGSPFSHVHVAWKAIGVATVCLNLVFARSGSLWTALGVKDFQASFDQGARRETLLRVCPLRLSPSLINQLSDAKRPVFVFSEPLMAGLANDALYATWYDLSFYNKATGIATAEQFASFCAAHGVDLIVLDSAWRLPACGPAFTDLVARCSESVAEMGTVSVRRLKSDLMFTHELLLNPNFIAKDGWSIADGAVFDPEAKIVTSRVSAPVTQSVPVVPGRRYRLSLSAKNSGQPTRGRLQVNWIGENGSFITTDIQTYDVTDDWSEHVQEVTAPSCARNAIIYLVSHDEIPVQFRFCSFKGSP